MMSMKRLLLTTTIAIAMIGAAHAQTSPSRVL
jgi:hypothetical protein